VYGAIGIVIGGAVRLVEGKLFRGFVDQSKRDVSKWRSSWC